MATLIIALIHGGQCTSGLVGLNAARGSVVEAVGSIAAAERVSLTSVPLNDRSSTMPSIDELGPGQQVMPDTCMTQQAAGAAPAAPKRTFDKPLAPRGDPSGELRVAVHASETDVTRLCVRRT